ncbi:MAG TPA: hypothetical protein VF067_03905 [Sphingomicrobium sp.]
MSLVHRGAQRIFRSVLALSCSAALAGCTSFEGAPRPVISLRDNLAMLTDYKIPIAIENFDGLTQSDPAAAVRYRNKVMTIYMNAMDAQYALFRRKLNDQRKGTNLGLDLATLGLTGAVPLVATGAKDVLGALANGATSSRTAIDKELYFEQTLPALLATMDAERDDAKTNLITNMKKSAADYPMAIAFADLNSYEASASFERATDKLTSSASADRQSSADRLENTITGCDTLDNLRDGRARINKRLRQADLPRAALDKMAVRVGAKATANATPSEIASTIRGQLLAGPCTKAALDQLADDFDRDVLDAGGK